MRLGSKFSRWTVCAWKSRSLKGRSRRARASSRRASGSAGSRRGRGGRSGPREVREAVRKLLMIMEICGTVKRIASGVPNDCTKIRRIVRDSTVPALRIACSAWRRRPAGRLCDNCERLLALPGAACPRCALPLPEDRLVRRVPSETARLRRRRDRLRLPISRRSPGAPVQVLRGPGDRGLPGRARWRGRSQAPRGPTSSSPPPRRRRGCASGASTRPWCWPGMWAKTLGCPVDARALAQDPPHASAVGARPGRPPPQPCGAFAVGRPLDGLQVAVVDDVMTTGRDALGPGAVN